MNQQISMNPRSLRSLLLKELSNVLQAAHFSEEYDFYYDSIRDAKERRRGRNPMSDEYTNRMNQKRKALGVSPLGQNGLPVDSSSNRKANEWAEKILIENNRYLNDELSSALFEVDPANTCCKENGCRDEYDKIASRITIKRDRAFEDALANAFSSSFGNDKFKADSFEKYQRGIINRMARNFSKAFRSHQDFVICLKSMRTEDIAEEVEEIKKSKSPCVLAGSGSSKCFEMMQKELELRDLPSKLLTIAR